MKTIVLIYPKVTEIEFMEPSVPYSIIFLGSYLSEKGYDVKIFDERVDDNIIKKIENLDILFVGISVMIGYQIKRAIELSKKIKGANNKIPIIWGGLCPTCIPQQVLNKDFVDSIVVGEGEEAIINLANDIKTKGKIKRVYKQRLNDFNKIPLNWNLINLEDYVYKTKKKRSITFITSRGCPFNCTFCYNQFFFKIKWKGWDIKKFKKELDKIINIGKINYIHFYHDNIIIDKKRFIEICKYLGKKNIKWKCELRADRIDSELLRLIEKNGCEEIFIGAESGSIKILNKINKNITPNILLNLVKLIKNSKIRLRFSWMIGFPFETNEDRSKTIGIIKKIRKKIPKSLHFIKIYTPYPMTQLYDECLKLGFILPNRLEEWIKYTREESPLPIKHKELLKTISYTSYFSLINPEEERIIGIKKLAFYILKVTSKLRWHFEFFLLPLEFKLIEKIRIKKQSKSIKK